MFHPLAPERIKAELPDVKLIAVLREPVDRLLSHYRYEVERGHETETLERALDLEESRLAGEVERLRTDVTYEGYPYRHYSYLHRGHYAEQIAHLHTLFAPEDVLVLQSEQMFADPNGTLARAWRFLGLEPVHLDHLVPLNATATRPDVDEATLQRIRDYYAPRNERCTPCPASTGAGPPLTSGPHGVGRSCERATTRVDVAYHVPRALCTDRRGRGP